jgi:hypothetical protein
MNQVELVRETLALWDHLARAYSGMAKEGAERGFARADDARAQLKAALEQTAEEIFNATLEGEKQAGKNPLLGAYREAFEIWERHTARYWDAVLRSPIFLEALGKGLEVALPLQRAAFEALEAFQRRAGFVKEA